MIQPVNGFIILKQLKKWTSNMFGEENEFLPNEFEIIWLDEEMNYEKRLEVWTVIIKWIHSGDLIIVDGEEYYIIKPDNILWIKTN